MSRFRRPLDSGPGRRRTARSDSAFSRAGRVLLDRPWVDLSPLLDQRVLRRKLRHALDPCFRENHISIAFPQRDVHVDAARPISVRVIDGADLRAGESP